jgi:predicted MFS family arabinose efflux permease
MDLFSGVQGLAGWQWLYLLEGLPSILVGLYVIRYLDSSIEEAKWLDAGEKALLIANINEEDSGKSAHKLLDAFRHPQVYVLCAVYFTLMVGLYGVTFWLPSIVKAFGVKGYLNIGLISAIPYGVAVVGMTFLTRSSDRTGERRLHYVGNVVVGAIGLVLSGYFASQPVLAMAFISLGTLGVIGSMPLFWPMPSAFLTGTAAAAGIGIINSVGNLGGYVGPNIPVWIKRITDAPSAAVDVIAAALVLGAVLILLFTPKTKPAVAG